MRWFFKVNVFLTNTNNERHEVVLRIQKSINSNANCLTEMNNGNGNIGIVLVTYKAEDNHELARGVYNGQFIIVGGGW